MTDKEKIITELKEALDSVDITSDLRLVLIRAIEYLQREPASEDLENEIERFLDEDENIPSYSKTARHFAEWGRNHFEDKREIVSEDLDYLVISLEETIGTSPHSREVIKEHLQKAAEWQKEKDKQLIGATQKISHQHGYDEGRADMREEMMKDAVDATVYEGIFNKYVKEQDEGALSKVLANFENCDRVKIIIVKEE